MIEYPTKLLCFVIMVVINKLGIFFYEKRRMEKRKGQIFTCLVGADTPQEIMTLVCDP